MTLFDAIADLQCNMNIVVYNNGTEIFKGTIGDLSTKAVWGQQPVKYQPFYNNEIRAYQVEIQAKKCEYWKTTRR